MLAAVRRPSAARTNAARMSAAKRNALRKSAQNVIRRQNATRLAAMIQSAAKDATAPLLTAARSSLQKSYLKGLASFDVTPKSWTV